MKRMLSVLLLCALLFSTALAGQTTSVGNVYEFGIQSINTYGNVILDVSGSAFLRLGFDFGDLIRVCAGDEIYVLPVGSNFMDVNHGKMVCRISISENPAYDYVALGINGGNFAVSTGLAERNPDEADSSSLWLYDADATITISMAQKQGYYSKYILRQMFMSTYRGDYPELTDEQYANFRMVSTTGMAPYTLYRSSSPVNPVINRNREADEALNRAGIETIINLTDTPSEMMAFEGFALTYYAQRSILPKPISIDILSDYFRENLAVIFRYMIRMKSPYLIHCVHGKDRTGFVCAVLECLMGASAEEVILDYMETYYNYYGLTPVFTDAYQETQNIIKDQLQESFGLENFMAEDADLSGAAEAYLLDIGLSAEEICDLRARLSGQ